MKRKDDGSILENDRTLKKTKSNGMILDPSRDEWCCVLEFLDTEDLFSRCALVCSEWNGMIRKKVPLRLDLSDAGWRYLAPLCDELEPTRIYSLSINGGINRLVDTDNDMKDGSSYSKIGLMTNLEKLSVTNVTSGSIKTCYIAKLDKLKHLNLSHTGIKSKDVKNLSSLTKLTFLDLSSNSLALESIKYLSNLKELTNLDMGETLSFDMPQDGMCGYLREFTKLSRLSLEMTPMGLIGTNHLSLLSGMTELLLPDCDIRAESMEHLSLLSGLTRLDLSGNTKCLGGLSHLSKLSKLKYLDLSDCEMTKHDIAPLSLFTSLTELELHSNENIGSDGIQYLSTLTNLTSLNLSECGLYSDSLPHLKTLTHLTELSLSSNGICHNGMDDLCEMSQLIRLNLSFCEIDEKSIDRLASITCLRSLDVSGNNHVFRTVAYMGRGNLPEEGIWTIEEENLSQLSKIANLTHLGMGLSTINDQCITYLNRLVNLESLDLSCSRFKIESNTLNLPKLTSLDISSHKNRVGMVDCLRGLKKLNHINISNPDNHTGPVIGGLLELINDGGLNCLKSIDISYSRVNTQDVSLLRHANIKSINLTGCDF